MLGHRAAYGADASGADSPMTWVSYAAWTCNLLSLVACQLVLFRDLEYGASWWSLAIDAAWTVLVLVTLALNLANTIWRYQAWRRLTTEWHLADRARQGG